MTPEGKVKKKVKALLKEHGAWSFAPVSGGMGVHGIPDYIACHRGVFLGIECKAPGKSGHVTALQKMQLAAIEKAGGLSMVVADEPDFYILNKRLEDISRAADD